MSSESDTMRSVEEEVSSQLPQATSDEVETGLGLIPMEGSTEALARTLLRAETRGYQTVLVATSTVDEQAVGFAHQLDIPVIDPPGELDDESGYYTILEIAGQAAGLEHLVVHTTITDPIDYERTNQIVDEKNECPVEAVPKSRPTARTVAAIPAYNEAATIEDVIGETGPHVDEVLVVDDGSDDDTAAIADAAGATVVEHETNRGYGAALNTVFTTAAEWDVDQLVVLDGDGQHEPADIPTLLDRLTDTNGEVVIGSRLTSDGETDIPVYRRFGLGVVNVLTNLSLCITSRAGWVSDTQSGFRAYDRKAIESLAADESISSGMDASTDILHHSHKQGYEIDEVGTTIYYDVEDGSRHHPVSHGVALVRNLLNTVERERPVLALGVPGFTSTLLGVGFGYWTIANYIATGAFPLGLAVVSVFFGLAGLFAAFTATILHSLKQLEDTL